MSCSEHTPFTWFVGAALRWAAFVLVMLAATPAARADIQEE